jgi:hypothetical protein
MSQRFIVDRLKKKIIEIINICKEEKTAEFISKSALILNLPRSVLENYVKNILAKDTNHRKQNFNHFSYNSRFKDLLKASLLCLWFLVSYFLLYLFPKKKKNYDLVVDGIISDIEASRWQEISKYFKKVCLVSKQKLHGDFRHNIKIFTYPKFFFFVGHNHTLLSRIKIIFFFFKVLKISFKYKKNYFFLFNLILYNFLKYNYIFKNVSSNLLIEEKFYATSALKNCIFKKNGGKLTSCIQKNILEIKMSSFIYTDIFFSLGKSTAQAINRFGGRVRKTIPVGSLYMERDWFNQKLDIDKIKEIDILILGGNQTKLWLSSKDHVDAYYESIKWLTKFSNKYKNIKVCLKHHDSYFKVSPDKKELKLLKNSNVDFLPSYDNKHKSYGYGFKSKICCSFASTMIVEFLGHGKPSFFLDPNFYNQQFFEHFSELNKYRFKTYKNFEKKMIYLLKNKRYKNYKANNDFCTNSKYVSKKIATYLKKVS